MSTQLNRCYEVTTHQRSTWSQRIDPRGLHAATQWLLRAEEQHGTALD